VDAAAIVRQRLWTDRRDDRGPFDIVGDVHGCFDELVALLGKLGYRVREDGGRYQVSHAEGRRLVFLGDLVDRGPRIVDCLRLAMDAVDQGVALCGPGNHEVKLLRKLRGRNVQLTHGLDATVAELDAQSPALRERIAAFIDALVSHYVLDGGGLVVAHAGMKAQMMNRSSRAVRDFALYGDTTGEIDEFGLPVRYDWAAEYRGVAAVVYGHTAVTEPASVHTHQIEGSWRREARKRAVVQPHDAHHLRGKHLTGGELADGDPIGEAHSGAGALGSPLVERIAQHRERDRRLALRHPTLLGELVDEPRHGIDLLCDLPGRRTRSGDGAPVIGHEESVDHLGAQPSEPLRR